MMYPHTNSTMYNSLLIGNGRADEEAAMVPTEPGVHAEG